MDNCSSETSGISATSKRNDFNVECQENMEKMKSKDLTSEPDEGSYPNSLTLLNSMELSKDDSVCGSKVEFDFFTPRKVVAGSSSWARNNQDSGENTKENTSETKTFSCNFCKREFSSSQALGGHQNAHKQERAIAKRRQGIDSTGVFGNPHFPYYYPYPTLSTHPLYGSYDNNRALRVPSYPNWTGLSYGHGAAGWSSRHAMLNPLQAHGSDGVGSMRSAPTSRMIENDDNGATGFIPHSGDSPANVAGSSNSTIKKPVLSGKDDDHPKQEEPSSNEHSELDLTLKL